MKISEAKKIIAKTARDYNLIAQHFNLTRQYNWPELKPFFKKYVKHNHKLLDIGCGNGRLQKILSPTINYTGIDISRELIKTAKNNSTNKNSKFKVGNILELPEPNNKFDIVTAIAILHHLPSKKCRQQALGEIYRVLKPDGFLIMTNWNLDQKKYSRYSNRNFALDQNLAKTDFLVPWKSADGKITTIRYYHSFNLTEIQNLLSRQQFNTIHNKIIKHNIISVSRKRS